MTLPALTITGLAKHLGVAVTSVYKHVDGVDALRDLVAELILSEWSPPAPTQPCVAEHLWEFSRSIRRLVNDNPGMGEYLIQVNQTTSADILATIDRHQRSVAEVYSLPLGPLSITIASIATHALAVSALSPPDVMATRDDDAMSRNSDLEALAEGIRATQSIPDFDPFEWSMRALIDGALRQALPES